MGFWGLGFSKVGIAALSWRIKEHGKSKDSGCIGIMGESGAPLGSGSVHFGGSYGSPHVLETPTRSISQLETLNPK